jgi:pantetheine-phosphate adenylyltransferase
MRTFPLAPAGAHGLLYSGAMNSIPKIGLFPGTFDPATNGHLDVIHRSRMIFDTLIVAVAHNPQKRELFSTDERLDMMRELVKDFGPVVRVETYHGLTVDYARKVGATAILRGLRSVTDLNFEFQLALTNRAVADVETIFIMSGEQYGFTSSTLIRQVATGGDIDRLHLLLPPIVLARLKQKREQLGERFRSLWIDQLKD